MSEWQEFFVEDIAAPGKNSLATGPFGSSISSKFFVEQGVPVIRGGNLSSDVGRRLNDEGLVFVSNDKAEEFSRSIVSSGDLIFTCWGTINQIGLIDDRADYLKYVISNKQMKLSTDPNKASSLFLYYLFSGPEKQQEILNNGIGAAVPGFNLGQLRKMIISLPSLDEQKAIAAVLSSFDEKIDLLHRQNKTLEAMAETLFRQWFVEGAQEDWEEVTLGDVVSVRGGTTPSTKEPEYWGGTVHWTTPRDLSNHTSVFLFDTERRITEKGLSQIGSGLLPTGTVLLSSRAPIGYLAISDILTAINQGYIAIVCNKQVSNYFMYLWCKTNMADIKNAGNGSTFEEISKSNFKALKLRVPPPANLKIFDETVESIFKKIKTNQKQVRTLEKKRNTILPKLVSGEVRVSY